MNNTDPRDAQYEITITKTSAFPIDYWEHYRSEAVLNKLMRNLMALLMSERRPVAVQLIETVTPDWPFGERYIYSLRTSIAREVPINVAIPQMKDYTHRWTLWQRVKFVFTNKLPY